MQGIFLERPRAKKIFLAITGLTPQVVTETLYAMLRQNPAGMPDEIHLLSTLEGIERARLTLLGDEPGWFRKFCRDHSLNGLRFDEDCLHPLAHDGGPGLQDIRTPQDNEAAANGITDWVRRFTSEPDTALHVSIAGGRKTMGFYAGYALSLYGREQDRLSHVLVEPPFESHPEFYYPTPYSRVIYSHSPDHKPLDTRDAQVTLAEIPFVRMRHGLAEGLLHGKSSFSDTVHAAQQSFSPPRLTINLAERRVLCGDKLVKLPPAELAFYTWLARRAMLVLPPLTCPPEGVPNRDYADEFLIEYRAIIGRLGDDERVVAGLRHGMEKDYFLMRKSRVNGMLEKVLGTTGRFYKIEGMGKRPTTAYGIALSTINITLETSGNQ